VKQQACVTCGRLFEPRRKSQKYCSEKCRNRKPGKKPGTHNKVPRACVLCGVEFMARSIPGEEQKFCSRACAVRFRHIDNGSVGRRLVGDMTKRIALSLPVPCVVCGKPFRRATPAQSICSDECVTARSREWSIKHHILKVYGDNGKDVTYRCRECGSVFAPEYGNKRRTFCSQSCLDRHSGRIRRQIERARLRGVRRESIDPIKVFIRDGWMCQICGITTPRRLRGTIEPNAPEMDHIVPLAAGGSHTYDNVQCACRACNNAKGAGVAHDQLRLELTA